MILRRLVLASASPRRLELLRSLGLEVGVRPSGYEEPDLPGTTPLELAISHARSKASLLRQAQDDALASELVVAADTVVDLDGVALGKPADGPDAARMLRALSDRDHLVHTAFALAVPHRSGLVEADSTTRVRFRKLSDDDIAEYVASGEPMDKAGAYGIQGRAAALVESISGDFYTVMGFPLGRFILTLKTLGFSLPIAKEAPNE